MNVHVSAKHRVVGVPVHPALKQLFPDAREIEVGGEPHMILPHGPGETIMLRNMGFDVPAPIVTQYDWCGGTPFAVQVKTCALLTTSQRAYVLNGMGTGKTKAALWAWDFLRKAGLAGKLLVVAPLSTLNFTWMREITATIPHRRAVVLHGTKPKRLARLADPEAEIFIINHDGLKVLQKEIEQRSDIDSLVVDELAVYRSPKSDRSKGMRPLAARMKWCWGMTGSPIPNSPTDAWAQCQIITPRSVPKRFTHFRDHLMQQVSQFKWIPKADAVERAFEAMQPAVRFTLDDVVELPEIIERTVDVELGGKQAKIYKEMSNHCYSAVQAGEITAANAGAMMNKLLQISLGYVYDKNRNVITLDNDLRLAALMDAIRSTDRKVLVFSPFKHAMAGIAQALTSEGIEFAEVSGDTPAQQRSQIFNLFQNTSKFRVLSAHPQCLAHGITLTAADACVWFGPMADLEIFSQANHRVRRVGQRHRQQIIMFQATPVERKIYIMLQRKEKVQSRFLELFEEASR